MDVYCYRVSPLLMRARRVAAALIAIVALVGAVSLHAQDLSVVGNQYVTASVVTDPSSTFGGGRFVIDAGPYYNGYRFLYFITSSVVFRIKSNIGTYLYTNTKPYAGGVPTIDGTTPVPYKPYDSVYYSTDTVVVIWKNMQGYTVSMRFFPERPQTIYDRGTDIIIEFSYTFDPFSAPAELGIFMMLDCYNGQAEGTGGGGDKSAVLTTSGYYPVDQPGALFQEPFSPVPEFYHVGNFLYQIPINNVLPIHRLRGFSHGGLPLTTPGQFAIGNWRSFRSQSWDIDVGGPAVGDCATICRWEGLRGTGTVRTAFGMDDKEGNNVFHCRDSKIFVDIRTARLIEQKAINGSYSPSAFNVEMWVTNTSDVQLTATITMETPIGAPTASGRLALDPASQAVQILPLAARATGKLVWRVNLAPGTNDSLLDVPLDFRYQLSGTTGGPKIFKLQCNPIVTIKGFYVPPPPVDTLPPPIDLVSRARNPLPNWAFKTYDRHPAYDYDTGLDRIVVEANDNNNIVFKYAPVNFTRCDIAETVNMIASVTDTTQSARLVFAVYDCHGNVSRDSAIYSPRPDIFKPEISRIDSTGSYGPPCNTRTFDVYLTDSINQTPTAGDVGFGSLTVLNRLINFDPVQVNFNRGGAPIRPFDPALSFRLKVTDTMQDADATLQILDFVGNADTLHLHYCTIPDNQQPRSTVIPTPNVADPLQGPKVWTVNASDTLAWDRGLEKVVVLDSSNMQYKPTPLTSGDPTTTFGASVIQDWSDAWITFEIRDRYYALTPGGHADTVRLVFAKIPDTLAPNIIYTPLPGTNGSVVDVEVNDIHRFGAVLYAYDRGLANININTLTSNMKMVTNPVYNPGDKTTTFRFMVIDTLALTKFDSICIDATDLYGNASSNCYRYPLQPDTLSPILLASIDPARTMITGLATDSRMYDRGLGSVVVENPVNLDASTVAQYGLSGAPSVPITISILDPTLPISGTFVVRDLVAERQPTSETEATHAVRIPFAIPAVHLKLEAPQTVDGNAEIHVAIISANTFPSALVDSVQFVVNYIGDALYLRSIDGSTSKLSIADNGKRLLVHWASTPPAVYQPGDTLGTIVFGSHGQSAIGVFTLAVDTAMLQINDGLGHMLSMQKPGDTAVSFMKLPAPYITMSSDSVTYVNGVCQRILTGRNSGSGKVNGVAILGIRPQPASIGSGAALSLDIRDLPLDGADVEVVAGDGHVVVTAPLTGSGLRITTIALPLPHDIPSGVYFVRVRGGGRVDYAKVLVVE